MLAKGCERWLTVISLSGVLTLFVWCVTRAVVLLPFVVFFAVLTVCAFVFFRDPERHGTLSDEHMLSPADGRIVDIRGRKICIFMSLADVHVNRIPIDGKIISVTHLPGGYLPAFDKDAASNERNVVLMETAYGPIEMTQIAGAWVRRIRSYVVPEDAVSQRQRFGVILFGSRVDITVPEDFELCVGLHDKVKAGTTVIAKIKAKN